MCHAEWCGEFLKDIGLPRGGSGDLPRDHYPNNLAKSLCALCAGTRSGNAVEYPRQYPNASTLFTVCYVGNLILAELLEIRKLLNAANKENETT